MTGWLDSARDLSVVDVATRLGFEVRRSPSSHHCACPACGAERRHAKTRDRRGSVGIPVTRSHTWACFTCGAAGDAIDFAAHKLAGERFRSLQEAGKAQVREFFGGDASSAFVAPRRVRTDALPVGWENADVQYPPYGEVEWLWEKACDPVDGDDEAAGYLGSRGITEVDVLAGAEAARALRRGIELPAWASVAGRPWSETGHRIVVPLYDFTGRMMSVLARSVDRGTRPKSVGTSGYQRRGLVMAGGYGRQMLMSGDNGSLHHMENFRLTIFEGEVDLLRGLATGADDVANENYQTASVRGALGIMSGSFTRDIASRVPSRSTVVLATDGDEQGDKYADEIRRLIGNRVTYERRPPEKD